MGCVLFIEWKKKKKKMQEATDALWTPTVGIVMVLEKSFDETFLKRFLTFATEVADH
jgi:hypothetical protein